MTTPNTNTQVQKRQPSPVEVAKGWIEAAMPEIEKVLVQGMPRDWWLRICFNAFHTNPALANCTRPSLLNAFMRAAVVGLEPDGTHAAIVPYGQEATFVPMYKGLIRKAREAGDVADIISAIVCENDLFEWELGSAPTLRHKPAGFGKRGEVVAFYAIAFFKDGRAPQFEVMEKAEVDAIRSRARAKGGPWATDYFEMGRKTPVRRLCKYLKLDAETQRLISEDERFEAADDAEVLDDGTKRATTLAALKTRLEEDAPKPQDGPAQKPTPEPRKTAPAQQTQPQAAQAPIDPNDDPWAADPQPEPQQEQPPQPTRAVDTRPFPTEPADWYDPAKGGIDPDSPDDLELAFGKQPDRKWAEWSNETHWLRGILKGRLPAELVRCDEGSEDHAALENAIEFARGYANLPAAARYADWTLALAKKRWAIQREIARSSKG